MSNAQGTRELVRFIWGKQPHRIVFVQYRGLQLEVEGRDLLGQPSWRVAEKVPSVHFSTYRAWKDVWAILAKPHSSSLPVGGTHVAFSTKVLLGEREGIEGILVEDEDWSGHGRSHDTSQDFYVQTVALGVPWGTRTKVYTKTGGDFTLHAMLFFLQEMPEYVYRIGENEQPTPLP